MNAARASACAALAVTSAIAIGAAVALAIGAGAASAAAADTPRAQFAVLATVRAVARIDAGAPQASFDVTTDDVARGYVEVAAPWNLRVTSNDPSGVRLQLLALAPLFRSIVVSGLGGDLQLGPTGGSVVLRWHDRRDAQLALRFRLLLAPGVQPGRYPWPLRVLARPLSSV